MESETATVAAFSLHGTDTMIIRPGPETCVPGLPSLTDLQSNQMLISHSNQIGLHKNSVISFHAAQSNRYIYDMESTQYNNMLFSGNLNAPGVKTGVPTKRSVPVSVDKRCIHSQINSASDEAEEQQVIDEKKQRRMLSNRESARRSRLRKQHHLDQLRTQEVHLREDNVEISKKLYIASQCYAHVAEENCLLRSEALELSRKLRRLHHLLNAQSLGVFKTMGIETRNCSAVHMSSESGTIADSMVSPNL